MSKLEFEIVNFLVILVLLLINVGGCWGQPLSSKFILKVKKQMTLPIEHVHTTFLTPRMVFVGILGFQSLTKHYKRPCRCLNLWICIWFIEVWTLRKWRHWLMGKIENKHGKVSWLTVIVLKAQPNLTELRSDYSTHALLSRLRKN